MNSENRWRGWRLLFDVGELADNSLRISRRDESFVANDDNRRRTFLNIHYTLTNVPRILTTIRRTPNSFPCIFTIIRRTPANFSRTITGIRRPWENIRRDDDSIMRCTPSFSFTNGERPTIRRYQSSLSKYSGTRLHSRLTC